MAQIFRGRVRDTSVTTGTGSIAVSGSAITTYRTFSAVMATNDTIWAAIVNRAANEWEIGLYTYSALNTLARVAGSVLDGSAGIGALVNFSAGTKDVFGIGPLSATAFSSNVVAKAGDTMTGTLNIAGSYPDLSAQNVMGKSSGLTRWLLNLGDSTFQLQRFDDAGNYLAPQAITIDRNSLYTVFGGAIVTQNTLQVDVPGTTNSASIHLSSGAGCFIFGKRAGAYRWVMQLGDNGAETGGSAGSDFSIIRYGDSGLLGYSLSISRATGDCTIGGNVILPADPTSALHAATKQYVDSASALKVSKAGDSMSGALALASGVNFGSQIAVSAINVSKHIALYGTTYGFNVQAGILNVVAAGAAPCNFTINGLQGPVGAGTPSTGAFTTLSASGTVSGAGITALLAPYALLASPALTGTPVAPTAGVGTNTTQIASTAFVLANAATVAPLMDGTAAVGVATKHAREDHVHPVDTSRVAKAGDTMTGGLTIAPVGTAALTLNKNASGVASTLYGAKGGLNRWELDLGDNTAESTGNVGSRFIVYRFNDAGSFIDAPFYIARDTGKAVFLQDFLAQASLTVGVQAYKPSGGPFADSSDARIKNVISDYTQGLQAVRQLTPRVYTYKANEVPAGAPLSEPDAPAVKAGEPNPRSPHYSVLGKEFIGLIAQETETAFPEMVTRVVSAIDGVAVTDMRTLDSTALIYALVNAVKELAQRVETLEAK